MKTEFRRTLEKIVLMTLVLIVYTALAILYIIGYAVFVEDKEFILTEELVVYNPTEYVVEKNVTYMEFTNELTGFQYRTGTTTINEGSPIYEIAGHMYIKDVSGGLVELEEISHD